VSGLPLFFLQVFSRAFWLWIIDVSIALMGSQVVSPVAVRRGHSVSPVDVERSRIPHAAFSFPGLRSGGQAIFACWGGSNASWCDAGAPQELKKRYLVPFAPASDALWVAKHRTEIGKWTPKPWLCGDSASARCILPGVKRLSINE
jgi:hypothetical protein